MNSLATGLEFSFMNLSLLGMQERRKERENRKRK